METKLAAHTPGPWKAECVGTSGRPENPRDIYQVTARDRRVRVAEYLTEGDARLIAASPRLLEVSKETSARLKECITVKELTGQDPAFLLQLVKDMWQKLDAVILEAESPERSRGAEGG